MTSVLAYHNRGEWNLAAEDNRHALDIIGEDIGGEQCDECGSFTEDGEIGPGFIVTLVNAEVPLFAAKCGCCGRMARIAWRDEDEVVF